MKVQHKDISPCRVRMTVEAGEDETRADYEAVLQQYRQEARVPGFRAGKAPRPVLLRHFAKAIQGQAAERLLQKLSRDALRDSRVEAEAMLDVEDLRFTPETGIHFSMILDVAPDFKLPRYKGLTLTDETEPLPPESVEAQLASLRKMMARYEDPADHALTRGDAAQIDYTGTLDETPLAELESSCRELGQGQDVWAEVDTPTLLPGLDTALEGMRAGETRDVDITFPEPFHVPTVAGRTARYRIAVKAVRARILPALDDEFATKMGQNSLAALRERIREQLQQNATQQEAARRRRLLADELIGHTRFDLPQSVIEEELRYTVRAMVAEGVRRGATADDLKENREALLKSASASSERNVRLRYILTRIARELQIAVDDEDVSRQIRLLAQQNRMPEPDVRERIVKNRGMDRLINEIRAEKAMDFVVAEAKIK